MFCKMDLRKNIEDQKEMFLNRLLFFMGKPANRTRCSLGCDFNVK